MQTGRGVHLYFDYPSDKTIRNSASKIAQGLDIRGEGGYVIVPPSTHPNGTLYSRGELGEHAPTISAPDWLLQMLSAGGADTCTTTTAFTAPIPHGKRNAALTSLAGTMRRRAMSVAAIEAALLAENAAHCTPPLPESEVRAIADSVSRYAPAGESNQETDVQQCSFSRGRFESRADGILFIGTDKEGEDQAARWICGPLQVLAKTRDTKSSSWGRLLEWFDADGVRHRWAMPLELLQGDGVDVRSELTRQGLSIAPGRSARDLLASFLQVWPSENRARCVERLGWHGAVYVTPAGSIGDDREQVVFQNAHAVEPAFSIAGSVEDWRREVAALAAGNSRLVFAISVALAGPLVEPAGEDSGGFHFRGDSSSGKTTALRVAASVWGNPSSYCRLWRATSNGLEGLAALHTDSLLVLDELAQIDPREAGDAAYLLANGRGKARASRSGAAREAASWRLLFLSAGEESLSALMARAGKRPTAGQEIRLADIPSDALAGLGAFETLNGHKTAGDLAMALRDAASRFHGAVGAEWIQRLVNDRRKLPDLTLDGLQQFVSEVLPENSGGQVARVARRFALAAVAGEIATHFGLTGWKEHEATLAAKECFAAWLTSFGGTGSLEERSLLAQVKAFFEQHGSSRFEAVDAPENLRIINRAGFCRTDTEGRREYLVFPEAFKREVSQGLIKSSQRRHFASTGG